MYEPGLSGAAKPERTNPMSTLTLLDEIDDLERLLAGAAAPICKPLRPGAVLAVADDDEEEDLFGEDDLGFDDIDEEDADEDSEDDEDAEDADEPDDD
jgi:hypothetical protein